MRPAQVNQWRYQLEKSLRRVFEEGKVESLPSRREEDLVSARLPDEFLKKTSR
jgi:hypothetical protein